MNDVCAEDFVGGWSYTPAEMTALWAHVRPKPVFKVLEFGCGNSTVKMYEYLAARCGKVVYDAYETAAEYAVEHPVIRVHMYDADHIHAVRLEPEVYDLILVDGPTGHARCQWFSKLRSHVGPDTVLLVDDFNHYACFGAELDRNFTYTTLSHADTPFRDGGEHSWKIVGGLVAHWDA